MSATAASRSAGLFLLLAACAVLPAHGQRPEPTKITPADDWLIKRPTEQELKAFLKSIPGRSPQEMLKTLETVDGFRMELVAAEPLVTSPVAAAFDEDGNLYVAEMRDYPYKPQPGKLPIGCVRLLRDTDGDGVYDKAEVFADHLLWAAGIAPWKGGVFVSAPPDIWYFKDTDGDGKADIRQKLYTGFGTQSQQHMLNNLQWSLDHRIYGSTSGNGGRIRPADRPGAEPVAVDRRDFRFDPVGGAFESVTGTWQFGNTFDDWGNRFVCNESRPLGQVVLPEHYLARNPYLPVPEAIRNVAPAPTPIFRISPVEHWRYVRSARRVAEHERTPTGPGVSHHVVDAGAGVTVYRGGAYPKQYYGTVFTGDAQNNLVHHRALVPNGVTFTSRRAEDKTEFVRSSDNWFRPVNFVNAPDGTLYCLDMSREIIESIHIPLDVVKHLDLTNGRTTGRIYRMAPPGFRPPPPPRLSKASAAELVAALESPHGWWRDTAHRLIYERQDRTLVPALERLARESKLPQARLHALWSLHGLNSLKDAVLLAALTDVEPPLREHAVRLAEPRLDQSVSLRDKVLALADDPNARVRFQVAFSLGETKDPRAVTALTRLAWAHANDIWMRTAVLSSIANAAGPMLLTLLDDATFVGSWPGPDMIEQLALVVGVRNRPEEVERTLRALATAPALAQKAPLRERLLLSLGAGLQRAGDRLHAAADNPAAPLLEQLRERSRKTAFDARAAESDRARAVRILGQFPFGQARETIAALLDPQQSPALQAAAVRSLAEYADKEVAPLLLARWGQYAPEVRQEVVQALLGREERTLALLQAANQGTASVATLDPTRRGLLSQHKNEAIRALAKKLFGTDTPTARGTVLAAYLPALKLAGEAVRGEKVYEKNCMACHRLGPKGAQVGPNLASSPAYDPDALLTNILDPNRYVQPNYEQYVIVEKSGRTYTGIIAAQTATSVTIVREQGQRDVILRGDIEQLTSTGRSLMPEGLEKNVGPQEMADLLAYLRMAIDKYGSETDERNRDHGTDPGLIEPAR